MTVTQPATLIVFVAETEGGKHQISLEPFIGSTAYSVPLPSNPRLLAEIEAALDGARRETTSSTQRSGPATRARPVKPPASARTTASKPRSAVVGGLKELRKRYSAAGAEVNRLKRERQAARAAGNHARDEALLAQLNVAKETQRTAKEAMAGAKAPPSQKQPARAKRETKHTAVIRTPRAHSIADMDSGVRFSDDPDADTRSVWVLKSGHKFHRRDCFLIEGRDGAACVPVAHARKRGLEVCQQCVPNVR